MGDASAFQAELGELLERRREWLDRSELPKLKDEFRAFHASFTGLYNVLLKKGVIQPDPYKSENKIGELQTPSEGPFSEGEKFDQMGIRLSNYDSQLDFLLNYYQFSADFLSIERIKKIVALLKYFAWTQFSANSQYINTRTLVELVGMVKGGNEALSAKIMADALQHLDKSSKTAFAILKEVSDYQREDYKLTLRTRVMSLLSIDADAAFTHKDDTLRTVKRKFAEVMGERPFYPELAEEVLREDFSSDGPQLREELQRKLRIDDDKPKAAKQAVSFKSTLMDGMRALASLNLTIDDALRKLEDNSAAVESTKNSFMDKLRRLIRQMLNKPPESVVYEVESLDAVSGITKAEKVDFTAFRAEAERKNRILASINNKNSTAVKKLEAATEEQVLSALSKHIEEMQSGHKTMAALDAWFKANGPAEVRDRMRGIKPELSAIKNGIVKANQKRHEYVAQKEELEQMKRLGIHGDEA